MALREVVTVPSGHQFVVAAHPVGTVLNVEQAPTVYLDAAGTNSERLLGGVSWLYWQLLKGGRWEVDIISSAGGDSAKWHKRWRIDGLRRLGF